MGERWPEKLERLLAEGKPWRAKEVLRGTIANSPYDRELYRRYAELLLELGEELESGKYFWLSGAGDERAQRAISVFLERHRRATGKQLYQQFPAAARVESWQPYPEGVAAELRRRGLGELPGWRERKQGGAERVPAWLIAGCAVGGLLLLASLIYTSISLLRWVVGHG